jgi:5'-phosphate synthase pdxT subunit
MILLAKKAADLQWQPVSAIDIEVKRNAFGRQVDSFEADLAIPALGDKPFHGVFIRAPIIDRVNPGVDILCRVNGSVVAVKQGKALACAFHPELTDDSRFHRYFLDLVTGEAIAQGSSR